MKTRCNDDKQQGYRANRFVALVGIGFLLAAWPHGALQAAETRYVNKDNPNPEFPYTSWETAATVIQAAIDAAGTGDLILVTNGVYDVGESAYSTIGSNRVVLTKAVTVMACSTNLADTLIVGASDNGTNGPASVRCAYVADGCLLSGFTLTNGYSGAAQHGGGIYGQGTGRGVVSNCLIVACNAYSGSGGGAYYGLLIGCTVRGCVAGNTSQAGGGGCRASSAINCLFIENTAYSGGGVYCSGGSYVNCTFRGNTGGSGANVGGYRTTVTTFENCLIEGGVYCDYRDLDRLRLNGCVIRDYKGSSYAIAGGTLYNSLIVSNTVTHNNGLLSNVRLHNCTVVANMTKSGYGALTTVSAGCAATNSIVFANLPANLSAGTYAISYSCIATDGVACTLDGLGNFTSDPQFAYADGGNYRLARGSVGINSGTYFSWMDDTTDLDGNPRIQEEIVDMGAYEAVPVPYLINLDVTDIAATSASLNGNLIFTGTSATVVWAYWGTTDGGTNKDAWAANACLSEQELGELTHQATSLAPDTRYYYTFYASNSFGGFWPYAGAVKFSTAGTPVVTNTGTATLNNTLMTLSGEVLAGYPAPTAWFYWGTVDGGEGDVEAWENSLSLGIVTKWEFSATVDVLPGRTYYYRSLVSNEFGMAWSTEATPFMLGGVHYVNKANPTPLSPYASWADAATNIQDAIDVAGMGEVVLVTNGVYDIGERAYSAIGSNRVVITNALTVMAVSTNPADTVIAGAPDMQSGSPKNGATAVRGVYLGADAVLRGFTVSNGYVAVWNTAANGRGGGIYADLNATVRDCFITTNQGYTGGGLYMAGNGMVSNCAITLNTGLNGGGVYSAGSRCYDCQIASNTATSTGNGGGVYADASSMISNCTVVFNYAKNGGAACYGNYYGCLLASNTIGWYGAGGYYGSYYGCQIVANRTTWEGGGLYYPALAQDCLIQDNTGRYGSGGHGGVYIRCHVSGNNNFQRTGAAIDGSYGGGLAYATNCLITLNYGGAGLGSVIAANCTVVSNKNSGVANTSTQSTLVNCIIYGNAPGDFKAGTYAVSYTCARTNIGTFPNSIGIITNNPKFVDFDAGDYHLASDSPCIDIGINQPWMGASKDLDGTNSRIVNATVDMGAYEYSDGSLNASFGADPLVGVVPTLNTFTALVSDPNPASLYYQWDFDNDGIVDLEGTGLDVVTHSYAEPGYYSSALTVANSLDLTCSFTNETYIKAGPITYFVATNGMDQFPYTNWTVAASNLPQVVGLLNHRDTVVVGDGTYEQAAQLTLSLGATVTSVNGAAKTALVRSPVASAFRVFQLNHANAVLNGFTIANGSLTAANNDGGGVYVSLGLLTHCIVNDCYTSRDGGGVYLNNSAAAQVRNCLLTGNTAGRYGGGAAVTKIGLLESCTIADNTASNAGGGVAAVALPGMRVVNSVVYNNTGVLSSNNWTVLASGVYTFTNCCTVPTNGLLGTGNTDGDPLFRNPDTGNYRLRPASSCFNGGVLLDWMDTAVDLDGQPRVMFGAPDIGAFECPVRQNEGALILIR